MDGILEATSEMGEWSVEVYRDSAYLKGTGYNGRAHGGEPEPRHTPRILRCGKDRVDESPAGETVRGLAFAIPAEDVGKVLAALDQIMDHQLYADFAHAHVCEGGRWLHEPTSDGFLRLKGPVIAFGSYEPWAVARGVELEYRTLADLREVLVAVPSAVTAVLS